MRRRVQACFGSPSLPRCQASDISTRSIETGIGRMVKPQDAACAFAKLRGSTVTRSDRATRVRARPNEVSLGARKDRRTTRLLRLEAQRETPDRTTCPLRDRSRIQVSLSKGSFRHDIPGVEALFTKSTNARTVGDSSRLLGKTTLTSTGSILHSGNSRTSLPALTSPAHTYAERPPMPAPLTTSR